MLSGSAVEDSLSVAIIPGFLLRITQDLISLLDGSKFVMRVFKTVRIFI